MAADTKVIRLLIGGIIAYYIAKIAIKLYFN